MSEKELFIINANNSLPLAQKLNQLEDEFEQLSEEIEQKKKFGCLWAMALGFSALMAILGVVAILAYGLKGFTSMLFFFAIASPPVILLVLRLRRIITCKTKIQELERNIANMQGDISLAWLPTEYRTGSCLNAIIGYAQNGRADTLKEALNILENEMHQQRMENAAAMGAYIGAQQGHN